jgi:diamine N-acetyltransferase
MQVREASRKEIPAIAMLVRESNRDVAIRFGLDHENCPKHPSFRDDGWIEADLARGKRYFLLESGDEAMACVAYEVPNPDLAYLNRLAVLPAHRRQGIGARLVGHILDLAEADGIAAVSIGIIGEHTELLQLYARQGFTSGETRRFPHLPFSVHYMPFAVRRG